MTVKAQPDGYHSVTPYIITHDAAGAIEFYKKAFGATELMRLPGPGGKVMHAEIKIGDSPVMLADEFPEMGIKSAKTIGGSPIHLMIYTDDCDAMFAQAIAAGAAEKKPMADQFYGDRSGSVEDPYGHEWTIATHIEDLTPEVVDQRFREMMQQGGGDGES
ncbi:MAG: VOC family protein [Planctomycetaceae bacterium]|nr:VOC family protein [Planctomycetales bacterium]MCB9938541.1 VOC family protein [Planctomycetaceae bacterium]